MSQRSGSDANPSYNINSSPKRRSSTAKSRQAGFARAQSPGPSLNGLPSPSLGRNSRSSFVEASVSNGVPTSHTATVSRTEATRERTGSVAEDLVSKLSMKEFRSRKSTFNWPENLSSDHHDYKHARTFPYASIATIGGSLQCRVLACRVEGSSHGISEMVAVKQIYGVEKDRLGTVERKVLKAISHQHVVAFLGSFTWMDTYCIVMFPVARWHLTQFMKIAADRSSDVGNPPLPDQKRLDWLRQLRAFMPCLCSALLYIHQERLIRHRDIKPKNILVDKHFNVLIADFGISTQFATEAEMATSGVNTKRTPQYAAPEVFEGLSKDRPSDVFSLGCVFLEMATVLCGHQVEALYREIGFTMKRRSVGGGQELQGVFAELLDPVSRFVNKLQAGIAAVDMREEYSLTVDLINSVTKMLSVKPAERPSLRDLIGKFKVPWHPCTCADHLGEHAAPGSQSIPTINEEVGPTTNGKTHVDHDSSWSPDTDAHDWASGPESKPAKSGKQLAAAAASIPYNNENAATTVQPAIHKPHAHHKTLTPSSNAGESSMPTQQYSPMRTPKRVSFDDKISALPSLDHKPIPTSESAEGRATFSKNTGTNEDTELMVYHYYQRRVYKTRRVDIYGSRLFVYDCQSETTQVVPKQEFDWRQKGYLMRLPRDRVGILCLPDKQVNLWLQASFKDNMARWFGYIKYVWVTGGTFTAHDLERFVLPESLP